MGSQVTTVVVSRGGPASYAQVVAQSKPSTLNLIHLPRFFTKRFWANSCPLCVVLKGPSSVKECRKKPGTHSFSLIGYSQQLQFLRRNIEAHWNGVAADVTSAWALRFQTAEFCFVCSKDCLAAAPIMASKHKQSSLSDSGHPTAVPSATHGVPSQSVHPPSSVSLGQPPPDASLLQPACLHVTSSVGSASTSSSTFASTTGVTDSSTALPLSCLSITFSSTLSASCDHG
jgi:hypothetical protein